MPPTWNGPRVTPLPACNTPAPSVTWPALWVTAPPGPPMAWTLLLFPPCSSGGHRTARHSAPRPAGLAPAVAELDLPGRELPTGKAGWCLFLHWREKLPEDQGMDRSSRGGMPEVRDPQGSGAPVTKGALLAGELNKRQRSGKTNSHPDNHQG